MKQHLLRVTRPVVEFGSLIAAMRHEGERAGWLELPAEAAEPIPESLLVAAQAGALRSVAVGGGRSVAIKPMRGEPVLRDLLREHFRGCRLVMIQGEIDAPSLEPDAYGTPEAGWIVKTSGGAARRWTTEKLIAALRKARPFEAT